MITTNFNPNIVRAQNSRQNNVNFQRKFNAEELIGIKQADDDVINNLSAFIPSGVIRAKDGADKQMEKLLQENPGHKWVKYIADMFYQYNPKK